jgi:hypothetical protein
MAAKQHNDMNWEKNTPCASIEVKAVADERSVVYLVRPSGTPTDYRNMGKIVCLCFDGEASVVKQKSLKRESEILPMPCSTQWEVEDEEMKDVGPAETLPSEFLSFEPVEAAWAAYESIWDEYPDAEELDLEKEWLEFGSMKTYIGADLEKSG